MNCSYVERLIDAYADGETGPLQRVPIERHLPGCAHCTERHRSALALRARVRAEVPRYAAPPALQARVRALAHAMQDSVPARPRERADRWRWLGGGVVAGCVASALAWMVGSAALTTIATNDLAGVAVARHVQATLDGHLIEVASSDRHTVKPWLSARLDYSPPVQDLADEGFPLVGGRLDSIEGRTVAALVYRYGQHTIDVFVCPDAPGAPALRTVRGFNVVRASGPSMDWVAVSDAESSVLTAFVQRLAREDVPR